MERLLARQYRHQLLDHGSRRRIFDKIREIPGIHMRRLERELGMGLTNLQHHLRVLETFGFVTSRRAGKRRTYFASDQVDRNDQSYLGILRSRMTRWILLELLENPRLSLQGITERVPVSAPTVSYHLKKLRDAGIVEPIRHRRRTIYALTDRERLNGIFAQYEPTFARLR